MIRGLRPPTLGTSIESSSGTIEVSAQPCFFLIFSASFTGVRSATATSFVKCSPPTCSTAVCHSEPFSKMARSVVPPPIVHQRHAQLLLVRGQAGLGRRQLGEDGVDHLQARAVHAGDRVLGGRRRSR